MKTIVVKMRRGKAEVKFQSRLFKESESGEEAAAARECLSFILEHVEMGYATVSKVVSNYTPGRLFGPD